MGCESIPYSDLRSNCTSQQSEVHPWCDGDRGPVKCEINVTRDIRAKLEREQRNLESLRERKRELEDKRSRATDDAERAKWTADLESITREIEASVNRIEALQREQTARREIVERTIVTLNRCIDYRRAVMNVFAYALDKVRGENEPDVRPHAEQLRDRYPQSIKGHEEQIENKKNTVDTCTKEL